MQKTVGLARAGSGRSQRNNFGYHLSNLNYDGKIAGLYDLEETLGRGHFAVVKLARHVFTGEKVAVKVIDKTKLDEVSRSHLFQEVRCMKLVQHPNVVRLYEVIDTQTKLYLILELGDGGDLYDYIMRHENGLDQQSARHYFRQVVHAISYCHQLHVVHRDLKPENVVFFEKLGMVKLTDFGFSNKYNPGQKLETSCGSLAYSAPEILLGDSYDAPAVDIWSLGVILYMLVCGHPPFQEANDSETLTMIMDCKYTVPPHVSEGCRRLIGRMLQRDPALRANLEEIANDPWLQEGAGIVQPAHYLPLVSREHLSEEDHALILQKMVNGNIATKEEILDALDKDEYNNITATYFLLAERKLRAQRQEQALSLSKVPPPPPPPPELEETVVEELKPSNVVVRPVVMESLQASSSAATGRQRKCSAVEEEDETAGASGSESSRRSQRSSSNSLASQRTSNTSLASQRASNNSLAGSLRARGLLPISSMSGRSSDLRLELNSGGEKIASLGACPKLPSLPEQLPEQPSKYTDLTSPTPPPSPPASSLAPPAEIFVPAPFPTTSGLGLRSPRVSPLTSPVTGQKSSSGRTTPASVSPTSPSTPSSPSSSGQNRSSMPSPPSRVLHTVRSSPQLILNEIFEEAESCSDTETAASSSTAATKAVVNKMQGSRQHHRGVNGMMKSRTGHQAASRASSAGALPLPTSSSSVVSPPNLVRRYEQRRQLIKARTASCSSSDASDDDNEGRKKRAEKLASAQFPPPPVRRDSHEDSSSDHGGEGCTGGHRATSGSGTSVESSKSGTAPEASKEAESGGRSGPGGGRSHTLPPVDCSATVEEEQSSNSSLTPTGSRSSRYRATPNSGRRYTDATCSFSLLSPGLSNETHLRASQSLSCLTEVCHELVPLVDCTCPDLLQLPDAIVAGRVSLPAKSCSNLKNLEESDGASAMVLLLRPCSSLPVEPSPSVVDSVQDVAMEEAGGSSAHDSCSCRPPPCAPAKKHKRLKQLFSRRDQGSSNSLLKKSEKRSSRKHRGRSSGISSKSEAMQAEANPVEQTETSDTPGRTMGGFLRSRLYKAKSLGSLVKERILVEASHCQYELWKRLGRKGGGDVNMNGGSVSALPALASKPSSASATTVPRSPPGLAVVIDNTTQHCSSC